MAVEKVHDFERAKRTTVWLNFVTDARLKRGHTMEKIKVLLVDSNKLFRQGLKLLLADSVFTVVSEAGNLNEAVNLSDSETCAGADLILCDLHDAEKDEVEAMRLLDTKLADAKIVVLTAELCPRRLSSALEAGADGYLMKDLSAESLVQSLRLVMMGEKVFPTDLAMLLISGRMESNGPMLSAAQKGLSPREVQILRCLLDGDSNKMIAIRLDITEATVKVHLKSLLRKINASNRTQAAIWALNHGLASESSPMSAIA